MAEVTNKTKRGTSKEAAKAARALFREVYINNGENGTRAYMQVYGVTNEGTAATEAHKLLKDPEMRAEIDRMRKERLAKYSLTADRVMQEIARIAYYDPRKLLDDKGNVKPLKDLDDDTAAAISAVEMEGGNILRVRPHSKNEALQKAVKILRLEEAPPPTPDEGGRFIDSKETAKWLAFMLAKGARALPKP